MQMRNHQNKNKAHRESNFYYTQKMATTLTEPFALSLVVGIAGSDAIGGCHGGDIETNERIRLILLGLVGLAITGTASLAGSVFTVPIDLALGAKEYCKNYNEATFFKVPKEQQNSSQLLVPESPKNSM